MSSAIGGGKRENQSTTTTHVIEGDEAVSNPNPNPSLDSEEVGSPERYCGSSKKISGTYSRWGWASNGTVVE